MLWLVKSADVRPRCHFAPMRKARLRIKLTHTEDRAEPRDLQINGDGALNKVYWQAELFLN